ncbi:hypothetical protein [Methylomicrobium lacus]|uniref:hypothetical protein n=1 Tax=Methylomicrobium lacus TaxID=136992 RepID=UPI00126919DA|nr:hypothetical protein [Methylomicrobium lacus]
MGDFLSSVPFIAIAISLASLYFSRKSWLQSNRPIITAFVSDHAKGNISTALNLVISNTGNRPATNVRLIASENDILRLIKPTAQAKRKKMILDCFQESAIIPILRNGEELSTCFGAITRNDTDENWMVNGAQIEIRVEYSDLDGRFYKSEMPLKIYSREGFAGGFWKEPSMG